MGEIRYTVYRSPFGLIGLVASQEGLLRLGFYGSEKGFRGWVLRNYPNSKQDSGFFSSLITQLERYFSGERVDFRFPLNPQGTRFQRKVWRKLTEIPYGQVRSYKWVAEQIGSPNSQRAVGNAVGANPIAIVIPCHRVIRSDGSIGGYGYGVAMKRRLLNLEGALTNP